MHHVQIKLPQPKHAVSVHEIERSPPLWKFEQECPPLYGLGFWLPKEFNEDLVRLMGEFVGYTFIRRTVVHGKIDLTNLQRKQLKRYKPPRYRVRHFSDLDSCDSVYCLFETEKSRLPCRFETKINARALDIYDLSNEKPSCVLHERWMNSFGW